MSELNGNTNSSTKLLQRFSEETKLHGHVTIPPHLLRYNLQYVIQDRLGRNTRGKCTEEKGFILEMKRITNTTGGILDKKTGAVHYDVEFIAQTLRPVVGDIIEAVVSRVFKMGVFADLGPLNIFIPLSRMPRCYQFETFPQPHFRDSSVTTRTGQLQPGSEIQLRIEKITMLDDNFLPSNSTCCVLKAMGELIDATASVRSMSNQQTH